MTLFRVDWSKDLFSLSFGQTGPYCSCLGWSLVFFDRVWSSECACYARAWSCSIWSVSMEIRGLRRCQVFVLMPLIDNVVFRIDAFCRSLFVICYVVSNTNSGVQFCPPSYFLSRFVRKPYLRASYHVCIFDWFLVRGGSFPSRNCLLLPLRTSSGMCVWAIDPFIKGPITGPRPDLRLELICAAHNTDVATLWSWYVPAEIEELNISAGSGLQEMPG